MYQSLGEFLLHELPIQLMARPELWALSVIALMAVTAVALYFFWDLVGRAVAFGARLWNRPRD